MAVFHGFEGSAKFSYGPQSTHVVERAIHEWQLQLQVETKQYLLCRPSNNLSVTFPLKQTFSEACLANVQFHMYLDDDHPIFKEVAYWYQVYDFTVELYLRTTSYVNFGNGRTPSLVATGTVTAADVRSPIRQCPTAIITLALNNMFTNF